MGVVVDSSLFIAAERGRFDWIGFHAQLGSQPLYLTVITRSELLHGAERADTLERRTARYRFISEVEVRYPLLPFGRDEACEYAALWAELSQRGALIGTHDLQIAAIARRAGFCVATLNSAEFRRVPNLEIIDAAPDRIELR